MKKGRTDLAFMQYLKAITIQPNHTIARVNVERTLKTMKLSNKAKALYNRYEHTLQMQSQTAKSNHLNPISYKPNIIYSRLELLIK